MLVQTTDGKRLVDATAGGNVVISFAVAPIVRDVREKVAELAAKRELAVRVRGVSYQARTMATDAIRLWLEAVPPCVSAPRQAAQRGTARAILKQAGVSEEEFFEGAGHRFPAGAGARSAAPLGGRQRGPNPPRPR